MLFSLALLACGPAAEDVTLDVPEVPGPTAALRWAADCRGAGVECTVLQMPYDHAHPELGTFPMTIARMRHRFNLDYKGAILMNFGGPGVDGTGYLPYFGPQFEPLRDSYDLVSFDVRGGGFGPDAEPLGCTDPELLDAVFDAYDGVSEEENVEAFGAAAKAWFDRCRETNPNLVDHMGMNAWADDMDVIREALGLEKISYYGASAGTGLGLTYAERHPERVDRFVLDSSLDAYGGAYGIYQGQLDGIQGASAAWAAWCAEDPACAVHDDPEGALAAVLDRAATDPLIAYDRPLNFGRAGYGFASNLYGPWAWSWAADALAAALDGDGTLLMDSFDGYWQRYPDEVGGITYGTQSLIANHVWCADNTNATTAADIAAWTVKDGAERGPLSKIGAFDLAWCLEVAPTDPVDHPATAAGTPAMLMLQSTTDLATPMSGALEIQGRLENDTRMVVVEGDTHVVLNVSTCALDHTLAYFADGTLPADGTTCTE